MKLCLGQAEVDEVISHAPIGEGDALDEVVKVAGQHPLLVLR